MNTVPSHMESSISTPRVSHESCKQILDSFFAEFSRATVQLRREQQNLLQRYHLRMEELVSQRQRAFAELIERAKEGGSLPVDSFRASNLDESVHEAPIIHGRNMSRVSFSQAKDSCDVLPFEETLWTVALPDDRRSSMSVCGNSSKNTTERNHSSNPKQWKLSVQKQFTTPVGPTREQIASMYYVEGTRSWRNFGVPSRIKINWSSLAQKGWHSRRVANLVQSRWFVLLVALLIVLNGVFIGIVSNYTVVNSIAEYNMRGKDESFVLATPPWETQIEMFFTFAFAIELLLRICAEELGFLFGVEWAWNALDSILVTASIAELFLSWSGEQIANVTFIRLLRLLRLVRTLRSVRMLRFLRLFSKFRMLLIAIQHSVVPLTWACFLLFWMLYLVSVVFLYGVSEYIGSGAVNESSVEELVNLFGGLDWTLLTLFMSITGGTSWETAVHAMLDVHLAYGLLFVFFVAAMTLAALNIIAGIFVNDAIEMAQMDRDIVIQAETERNKAMISELHELFKEFDTDNSDTLSLDELTEAWKRNPEVAARFRMLGVEELDASSLFSMLDVEGHEQLDIKEFVTGCLRVKTLTKPMDIQTFMRETRRNARMYREQLGVLEHHVNHVALKLDSVHKDVRSRQAGDDAKGALRSKWHQMREMCAGNMVSFSSDVEPLSDRPVFFPTLDKPAGEPESSTQNTLQRAASCPQRIRAVSRPLDLPTMSACV